jgi:hypothetical protein
MYTQTTQAAVRDTMQGFIMVSTFGFWALLLGFVPVAAIHMLTA